MSIGCTSAPAASGMVDRAVHPSVGLPFFGVLENLRQKWPRALGGPPEGSNEWRNKVAVVTGASSGIGRECALKLAGSGAQVVLAARSAGRLEAIAEECRVLGGEAAVIRTDVADEDQCRRLIAETVRRFGKLDLLVNNAGVGLVSMFGDLPDLGRNILNKNATP